MRMNTRLCISANLKLQSAILVKNCPHPLAILEEENGYFAGTAGEKKMYLWVKYKIGIFSGLPIV